ncbi:Type III secretion system SsaH protein [Candidatus Glomeribacter gigasporarum BEG34]|uniref:Type III secretion system SsaH protein n=1 Tax=Candidatus Glomeribacter gigasporarum BEG34 TaxID=1070319 RepID=G2J8Z1_9BURK|nr:EscG/YscG/SsaH family type III secretion system needle protein co-chaperone [Candidatus Glomeribacter gigasporarum]CCD29238.1 Type III secretion system SsaH protein [Candidatus Glomeribacter gigasporarum BEG34]
MSAVLQQEIKRLLVEAAIAAPNYGLTMPAQGLLNALPALGLDRETKALTTAMIRFGLKKPRSALNALKGIDNEDARVLRQTIVEYLEEMERKRRAWMG